MKYNEDLIAKQQSAYAVEGVDEEVTLISHLTWIKDAHMFRIGTSCCDSRKEETSIHLYRGKEAEW